MLAVEFKLAIYGLGCKRVEVSGLIASLNAMRERLQTLAAIAVPSRFHPNSKTIVTDHQSLNSAIGAEAISSTQRLSDRSLVFLVLVLWNQVQPPLCWPGSIRHLPPHHRLTAREAPSDFPT